MSAARILEGDVVLWDVDRQVDVDVPARVEAHDFSLQTADVAHANEVLVELVLLSVGYELDDCKRKEVES